MRPCPFVKKLHTVRYTGPGAEPASCRGSWFYQSGQKSSERRGSADPPGTAGRPKLAMAAAEVVWAEPRQAPWLLCGGIWARQLRKGSHNERVRKIFPGACGSLANPAHSGFTDTSLRTFPSRET